MEGLADEATDQVYGNVRSTTDRNDQAKVCGQCSDDNHTEQATGWCETCDEMLCYDCYKGHCKLKMARHHQLWSIAKMENRRKTKKLGNRCEIHGRKTLRYFCKDHAELGCSQCFVTKHRPCSNVVCISEVTTCGSDEFKALQLLLSKLEDRLKNLEEKKDEKLSITGRQHNEAIVGMQEAGEKIKALIDTLVNEQIAKAEMIKDDNIKNIDKGDGMKKEVEEKLTTARNMLAAVKDDNNQLFITMKHFQGETKELESKLGDAEQNCTIKECKFLLNPELSRLLDMMTELGTLTIDTREVNKYEATEEGVNVSELAHVPYLYDDFDSGYILQSWE